MIVEPQEPDTSATFELLSSCSKELGLQGLARVAASSKHLKGTCIIIARRDARSLLLDALEQPNSITDDAEQEVHLQAVVWFLQAAPTEAAGATAAADVAQRLMRLPEGRLYWALQLVVAGARITYAQLLAAACSMVPGVEVWVQAQQQLEVATDIPAAAVAICCGNPADIGIWSMAQLLTQLSPQEAADLLQLAVNCSSNVTAEVTAAWLACGWHAYQQGLNARRILVTAAVRQHAKVLCYLAIMAGVQEHVDAPTFEAVVSHLMARHELQCVGLLRCWRAAARQFSSEDVARLILAALKQPQKQSNQPQHESELAVDLMSLQAAQQLNASAVADIIMASVKHRSSRCLLLLRAMPTAQQLISDRMMQLLRAAVQQGSGECTLLLCQLPAAQQLNSSEVVELLTAIQRSTEGADRQSRLYEPYDMHTKHICELPAAQQLSSEAAAELLHAGAQCDSQQCIHMLCEALPAAQQLSSEVVTELLGVALQQESMLCTRYLCRLPGALQLGTDAVVRLLQGALTKGVCSDISYVCSLPATQQLSGEVLVQLLQAAVERGSGGVHYLCMLPAAQALTSDCLMQLLQADLSVGGWCGQFHCRLPGAQQLSSECVAQLLLQAVERKRGANESFAMDTTIHQLCWLPGAKGISNAIVTQLQDAGVDASRFVGMAAGQ